MKRGELWIASGPSYAGKPRPVVVQDESTSASESTIVCLVTSKEPKDMTARVRIEPSADNRLERTSWVMVEKVYAMHPQSFRQLKAA